MMNVALDFGNHMDIISVPVEIGDNIEEYQSLFDEWLYDGNNDHGYAVIINGEKYGVSWGSEAFVRYLNEHHIKNEAKKAKIVTSDIPILHF